MSDELHDHAAFAAIAISLIAIVVGSALLPRHPPQQDVVPRAGRRLNNPVAALPPSGAYQQPTAQPASLPQAHHRVHREGPVAAVDPPPPPSYLEYHSDTRIDGTVPSYSIGIPRGGTVNAIPPPNRDSPPQ